MEKTGEVRKDITPCDVCGRPATTVIDKRARCSEHQVEDKAASVAVSLKSFTEPLRSN